MAETYDLIITGGTVVNHDGTGQRDIGVRAARAPNGLGRDDDED